MTYQEKIERLFSKVPSYQKVGKVAYKPGIESMKTFDARLGEPHRKFVSIHIAGTNGKGSVSSMLSAVLACAGFKVGLYTSPHLLDFRERIKIITREGCESIPRQDVSRFLDEWDSFIDAVNPSFFEITTAMAFDFFARRGVDVAVIECGLGGRLDSTNVITPALSVITNIGLEHCDYLGFTLQDIAGEKAGIIKEGVPVVIGEAVNETRPVFEAKASLFNSEIFFAEECIGVQTSDNQMIISLDKLLKIKPLGLGGEYQKINMRTVCCALSVLDSMNGILKGRLSENSIKEGIANAAEITGLHGRWEMLSSRPDIICDIGHNAHGLKHVFSQLSQAATQYRHIYIIFGVVGDKDIDAIAPLMVHQSDKFSYMFTQPSTQRRKPVEELAAVLKLHGIEGEQFKTVTEAISAAKTVAKEKDMIFIGGSNFVVADALATLFKDHEH